MIQNLWVYVACELRLQGQLSAALRSECAALHKYKIPQCAMIAGCLSCVRTSALTNDIEPDRSSRLGDGHDSHWLGHGSRLQHREVIGPLGEQQWQR